MLVHINQGGLPGAQQRTLDGPLLPKHRLNKLQAAGNAPGIDIKILHLRQVGQPKFASLGTMPTLRDSRLAKFHNPRHTGQEHTA